MLAYFVGILEGDGDNWGARIFDIDGCVGAGRTPDEAIAGVPEALRDVIAHKRNGNHPIPSPSSIAHVLASGEVKASEHLVLVPLLAEVSQHAPAGA